MGNIIVHQENYSKIIINKHSDKVWKPSEEIEKIIEDRWQKNLEKNPNIWSAPMVRLESIIQSTDALHLVTSTTEYKQHAGTRDQTEKENRANPIYVSANIITNDNQLVFGLRDNCDRGNNQYNIAAGAVHPVLDAPDGVPSLGVALYREIFEEFGLIPESFESVKPKMVFGLKKEPTSSFLYNINLNIGQDEVKRKLDAAIKRAEDFGMAPEMVDVHFVENNQKAIQKELETNPDSYRPMIQAMLRYISS
ncbi:hypothetical protein KY332_05255 [Candidatus Woesearchaeota archaeon]|nr:hypothetical protein [Candidatus Woesearchaeota archaeon]